MLSGGGGPMSALGQKQTYAVHQPMSALPPIATIKADLSQTAMSALPPKADMCGAARDVRFGPEADIKSFIDHLVGAHEQRRRHVETERFRCFEVKHCFVPSRRLYRKVDGLGAAQDAVDIGRRLPKHFDLVSPIGHETTGCNKQTGRVDRWQAVPGRKSDNEISMNVGRRVRRQDQTAVRHSRK